MKRKRIISALLAAAAITTVFSSNAYAGKYYATSSSNVQNTNGKVGTGSMPVLAEGESMTVEAAVTRAVDRDSTIKTYEDNIDIAEDSLDDNLVNSRVDYNDDQYPGEAFQILTGLAVARKQLTNSISTYKTKIDVRKQTIEYQVESYFINIINAQNDLAIYDEKIDIERRKLEIYKKQYELGMLSQTQYDSYVTAYDAVVTAKTNLENTISSNYASLNTLLDYNVGATYPVELNDTTYTTIDPTGLDAHVALATSVNNLNIKMLQDSVDVAKYELSVFSDLYSSDTRLQKEASLYSATSSLNDTKLTYEATVKNLYDGIIYTEKSYASTVENYNTLTNTMSVYEKQAELGQITQLQLDSYKYELKDLKNTLNELEYSHYLSVKQYENPNLLG